MTSFGKAPNTAFMTDSPEVLVYVDLDGVVQHQAVQWHHTRGIHINQALGPGRTLFEWLPLLEAALEPFPSVGLVLSSSWCVRPGYGKTMKKLTPAMRAKFVGGTFNRGVMRLESGGQQAFVDLPRWQQIAIDVERRRPRDWLALDDDVLDWPQEISEHLVACDGQVGLSSLATQAELTTKLRNCFAKLSSA